MKNLSLCMLFGLLALYAAVWPHELGHAASAWWLGCKADPWRTATEPLLWGSGGGAIDAGCLAARGPAAVAVVASAGVAANLLVLILAPLIGRWWRDPRALRPAGRWVFVLTLLLALANAAEAFSYLVFNTLWLRADMRLAVGAVGGRWGWFAAGVLGAVLAAGALRRPVQRAAEVLASPPLPAGLFRLGFVLYAAAVAVAATVERILIG
jgi:hypothetical protein